MPDDAPPSGLRALPGGRVDEPTDARVAAVLEVLGGKSAAEVAERWGTDVALVHRWVRTFVEGGSAHVTNVPIADAARQRDRFLAAFAHELRTPLTVARGWVDLLADDDIPPAAAHRTVARLQDSLDRLGDRLVDVELLASASLGLLQVTRSGMTSGELVAAVEGPETVGGAGPEVTLAVDPELFPIVVRDLWAAAQLPPSPRDVRFEVEMVDPWVELRVVRDAEPIETDVLQALFEPFDLNADDTGVTLGLYLARALVVAHGGTLGVDQDEATACFWVRIQRTLVI